MTIEQTIEIPASRRLVLEIPPEIPTGMVRLTFTTETETGDTSKIRANPYEAIDQLEGLAKTLGSRLSVDRFLQMRQEDSELEEAKFQRLFHKECIN